MLRCCFLIRRLFASSLKREGERVNASAENAGPRREASPTARKFLMSAAIGGWTVRKRIVDSRSTSPPMQTAETRSLCTRTGESTDDKSIGANANKTGILLRRYAALFGSVERNKIKILLRSTLEIYRKLCYNHIYMITQASSAETLRQYCRGMDFAALSFRKTRSECSAVYSCNAQSSRYTDGSAACAAPDDFCNSHTRCDTFLFPGKEPFPNGTLHRLSADPPRISVLP